MDNLVLREIESQLSMDSELLLRMLGASHSLGATPGTIRDGKAILENAKRSFKQQVCADPKVQSTYRASGNSKVLLAAAVLDCIAGAVTGVSPITVAVLLVKEGLGSLCKDTWSNDKES